MKLAILLCCMAAAACARHWNRHDLHRAKWYGHGYYSPAPLNSDGTVADTEDVRRTKLAHLEAVEDAKLKTADWHGPWDHAWRDKAGWREWRQGKGDWRNWHRGGDWSDWHQKGHWAWKPAPLNPDGTVAETPEVRHLKAEHLAAHARAEARLHHAKLWHHGPIYAKHHDYWPASYHHDG